MRALRLLLVVLVGGCAQSVTPPVSQRQILRQAKMEIAQREWWAPRAVIFASDFRGVVHHTWKVRAGEFDYSDFPRYNGIYLVPGTERELWFTDQGCLIQYVDRSSPCIRPATVTVESFGQK